MSALPAPTVLEGGRTSAPTPGGPAPPDSWNLDTIAAVEVVAPDHYCATLLLNYGSASFQAEIIPGPGWVVRFHRPATKADWVTDLLDLVETWIRGVPLPCAKVRHGDREYLIRAPSNPAPTTLTPQGAA